MKQNPCINESYSMKTPLVVELYEQRFYFVKRAKDSGMGRQWLKVNINVFQGLWGPSTSPKEMVCSEWEEVFRRTSTLCLRFAMSVAGPLPLLPLAWFSLPLSPLSPLPLLSLPLSPLPLLPLPLVSLPLCHLDMPLQSQGWSRDVSSVSGQSALRLSGGRHRRLLQGFRQGDTFVQKLALAQLIYLPCLVGQECPDKAWQVWLCRVWPGQVYLAIFLISILQPQGFEF